MDLNIAEVILRSEQCSISQDPRCRILKIGLVSFFHSPNLEIILKVQVMYICKGVNKQKTLGTLKRKCS